MASGQLDSEPRFILTYYNFNVYNGNGAQSKQQHLRGVRGGEMQTEYKEGTTTTPTTTTKTTHIGGVRGGAMQTEYTNMNHAYCNSR
jgi:hypothetical protein